MGLFDQGPGPGAHLGSGSAREQRRAVGVAGVLAGVAAIALGGCPEPEKRFREFVGRAPTVDAGAAVEDGGGGAIADVTGTFLLAIATTIAPDRPLQFLAEVTLTPAAAGTATLSLVAQPLSVAARTAVGSPIAVSNVAVDARGRLTLPFGAQTVTGAANPISGSDILATITLTGAIASADRFCGTVTGMVTMPIQIDLAGSVWGAIRVPAGTVGTALPPPDTTCVLAAPLDGGFADGAASDAHAPDDAAAGDAGASPDGGAAGDGP